MNVQKEEATPLNQSSANRNKCTLKLQWFNISSLKLRARDQLIQERKYPKHPFFLNCPWNLLSPQLWNCRVGTAEEHFNT
ncbi:hypothetical protein SLEP1_g57865 [Rubroshorea leprosula]|uniref:Ycf15 n=1 Tax=Rubroshorea leprosula TaxID=152421 RepID=A0AAV5MPX3_9ROSI|nr:hypothetical protein SLEP1_g57865 [Rubroshorea leprosula]